MELMDRLAGTPRGALAAGTFFAAVVAIAVFFLGAPGWVLVPTMLIGGTVYAELGMWVERRIDRRR